LSPRPGITVITNWRDLAHADAGGAEVYCDEVARRLVRDGRRVVMLTAAVAGRPRSEMVNGYRVVRRGSRLGVYPAVLAWLWSHRRRIDAVIDSQNGIPFFAPLALRRSTPVLLLLHHIHRDQFGAYFSPATASVGRWLEGPASRRVYGRRTVVAVSPSTRTAARRILELRGQIFVAPPGCAVAPTRDPALRRRRPTPAIVAVGRMVRHKRFELLIEAMPAIAAAHPDVELHLVGDGPERLHLERIAVTTGLRIIFHGSLGAAERDAVVASSWVGVNCTAGEGWGISVIEANAAGLPVVGFRVPGLRDSIRDGETGWLVDEGGDLAAQIVHSLDLLADPGVAARWSEQTVAWADRADWDTTAAVLDDIIESERGRLAAQDNRRDPTDLVTHVWVPTDLLPDGWDPRFRRSDRSVRDDQGLSVLLPGADLSDAATALRRAGLPTALSHHDRVEVRIARPTDLVHPGSGRTDTARDRAQVTPMRTGSASA
jgi:glycosyltransferase involved in cell wall biosynthesis